MAHSSQCAECFYFGEDWTCKAFPKGIPDEISDGDFDHSKKFKGDNGVRFKSHEDRLAEIDKVLDNA